MFGLSFGELVVVVVVAVVMIGPKDMPKVLRKLGQWAGQLRRMASDLRAQSGIDDVLRTEGLTEDLNEIRKLARGELDAIRRDATIAVHEPARSPSSYEDDYAFGIGRDREQPRDGPDTANALPDSAFIYAEGFPRSAYAADPVWKYGEETAPEGAATEAPVPAPPAAVAHDPEPTPVDQPVPPAGVPVDAGTSEAPAASGPPVAAPDPS